MSVIVNFSDPYGGKNRQVMLYYPHGNYSVNAFHLTCSIAANRYGRKFIERLKAKRNK